jgi:hypothetical protein
MGTASVLYITISSLLKSRSVAKYFKNEKILKLFIVGYYEKNIFLSYIILCILKHLSQIYLVKNNEIWKNKAFMLEYIIYTSKYGSL